MMDQTVAVCDMQASLPAIPGFIPKIQLLDASKPYNRENCQIEANNDIAATKSWLSQHSNKITTFKSYQREAERLLLWCVYERGLSLGELKVEDLEAYFKFLANPPSTWCTTKSNLRTSPKGTASWRPFLGPLKPSALMTAVRIINSLFNYLVDAEYLRVNPLRLIKKYRRFSIDMEEHKYKVWTRMLEADEWAAVQDALKSMPEETAAEIDNKMRTQVLFALLYLLGLRIGDVAVSSWSAFRKHQGQWWFFVRGKGDRPGHIPVNDQLLTYLKTYRLYLGKTPLPNIDETENLLISKKTKRPLSAKQLYSFVKNIGNVAASYFPDNSQKQEKLRNLSPHWLRHLSASHQDKAGIPITHIKANHRHVSSQTTQIYVHGEDKLRFEEMQKLRLAFEPKLAEVKKEPKSHLLTITLKGNPLCESYSLERLLDVIEGNIFRDITWKGQGDDKSGLVKRYEKLRAFGRPLEIVYQLDDLKEGELDFIGRTIIREAEIRLFTCVI